MLAEATKHKRVLDRPKNVADILGWTIEGKTTREIAALLTEKKIPVSRQAVEGFLRRHRPELEDMAQRVQESKAQALIASSEARMADLQMLRDRILMLVERDGLEAEDVKIASNGDTVGVKYFNAPLVKELRGVLDDAAKEMGARASKADGASALAQAAAIVIVRGGPSLGI